MNTQRIILACATSASISLVGCRGYAVALHNVHPSSANESLLIQSSVLAVDIPRGLGGLQAKDLAIEVFKGGRELKQSRISKEDITKRNSRWNVDISPAKWSTGSYDLMFFSSNKLVHQLEADFNYEFITPMDY